MMDTLTEDNICRHCYQRHQSVFSVLNEEELQELSVNNICNRYKKGQSIILEGNRPTGVYFVHHGKIKKCITGSEGKEQIIGFSKDEDIVGYRDILSGYNHSFSAATLTDSELCFIPKNIFVKLINTNVAFANKIIALLANDLRKAQVELADFMQKPVRERVAEGLLILDEFFGLQKDGVTIDVSLSREELAIMIGTAKETLVRFLSEFKKEGIIDLDNHSIKILSHSRLLKAAHFSSYKKRTVLI